MSLASRLLGDRARGLAGWAAGLVAYTLLIVSIFPTIRDSESFAAALEDYPDALKELLGGDVGFDLTSGPGFIGAELYYLVLPLLLVVVAIGHGAALGADQESGLLDLILANPVRRRTVVLSRALAMLVAVTGLTAVVAVTVWIAGPVVELGIGTGNLVAASLGTIGLVMVHGLLALATAAVTGRRSLAIGIPTVLFAAGYLLNVAAGVLDWVEPLTVLSPYNQATADSPLAAGLAVGSAVALAVESLLILAVAVVVFDRRDVV